MYSEQLKKEKICSGNAGIKTAIMGVDFEEKDVCMMIDCFCQKEDVLGVPPNKLFDLFDDFCEKCGYLKISHRTLGRIFREHFNLKRKRVRKGKNFIGCMYLLIKPTLKNEMEANMENGLYTAHEVAVILADAFGDDCACNFNGNDEWLPFKCELLDACPNPYGVACWEQYLKYRHCKNEMEAKEDGRKEKKTYFVKCTVNMCANEERSVIVKATKPHLAMQKAEAECRNNGCFSAKAFYCNEMNGA